MGDWKTKPIFLARKRARSWRAMLAYCFCSTSSAPAVGRNSPPTMFRNVVFPLPDGPAMHSCSPRIAWTVTSTKACTPRLLEPKQQPRAKVWTIESDLYKCPIKFLLSCERLSGSLDSSPSEAQKKVVRIITSFCAIVKRAFKNSGERSLRIGTAE